MRLVIHDLDQNQWQEIAKDYEDCEIISDNGKIRPCVGCFGCWNKNPGKCVMNDGYENMGYLIHHADEVIVISKYTYGGVSSFVKNVFDRSLSYVLPHFDIFNGESHHKKRYDEEKPYTFIFYGHDLSDQEKESARRYVKAVSNNMHTLIKDVIFKECEEERKPSVTDSQDPHQKVILLNASMRFKDGNSAKLVKQLSIQLKKDKQIIDLAKYLDKMDELAEILEEASDLVLCTPLYVDGLPSQLIRLMEIMQEKYQGESKKVYLLSNMGLYENRQLINLFDATKQWCKIMNFTYSGGLGLGAGELVGGFMNANRFGKWPLKKIAKAMDQLSYAIDKSSEIKDIFCGPEFPRFLYLAIANSGWKRMAKYNGITEKDLYRRL